MLYFDLSGWFDSFTFKRWFVELWLVNADLVKLTKEKSVYFVMLPANATNWI